MIKLLFRLSYGEIMEVGEGRNFGIPQIPWCIFEFSVDFPAVVFFNGCLRLVFSRFFDIRENLGNVKKKKGFSSFLSFTDWRNPAILVYGCLYYDVFMKVLKKSLKGEKSLAKCSKYKDK